MLLLLNCRCVCCMLCGSNFWLALLYALLVIIKFSLLLFGPSLFIAAVESMSQEHIPYVVELSPKDSFTRTVCLLQKGTPIPSNLRFKSKVDLRARKGFHKLKDAAASIVPGKPTKVKFSQYDIMVNYKRMLTENIVEVGLFASLFRSIFKCKIRNVGPFQTCCKTNMLMGCPCAKDKPLPWIRFFRQLANGMLIVLIPWPYYLRLLVFYTCEYDEVMARKDVIERNGLKERYENSMIHYFTPTHPLFIIIYVVYATTAVVLAFMSRKNSEGRIMQIIVGAFRDLRMLSWTETLSMVVSNLLWPLKRFGLLGFLVGILYWPIAIPFTVFIGLVYALPTVYLSIRMVFYSKSAIFERAKKIKKVKKYQVSDKTDTDMHKFEADKLLKKSPIRGQSSIENVDDLGLDDIDSSAPKEHFKNLKDNISIASSIIKYQTTNWRRFVTYILSAILCIATLYATVIILSEVIGCLVEVVVFTIMGIIVNASAMIKYVMLILMIFIYSCDCFNNMEKKYLKLNKALFSEVKSRIKNISDVTSKPAELQENSAFKSQELGDQADYESPDMIVSKPLNHWMLNDVVLFIDSQDMPRIPCQLFDEVCDIRVAGVPGPVYRGLIDAFEQFFKAVLFVLFVFIIVLTFGAVYKVSTANQTLATMVGGLLPMMLKTFLAPPTPDVEIGTVSFKSKMDEVIKNFSQYWPIYDLPFNVVPPEAETKDVPGDGTEGKDGAEKHEESEASSSNESESLVPKPDKNHKLDAMPAPVFIPPQQLRQPHILNLIASTQHHEDVDGEMSSMLHNNNVGRPDDDLAAEPPRTPTGAEKCVRIAEEAGMTEVDLLIYMPDKYDDVWLEEWSDIVSRTSKTHVNAADIA